MKTRGSLKYFVDDCRFVYSPLERILEKQIKIIQDQEEKQAEALKKLLNKKTKQLSIKYEFTVDQLSEEAKNENAKIKEIKKNGK